MTGEYDAMVVGARCAGASTAMLLARKGHKVLLVDRSRFPSDIPHGHLIHRHGPRRLRDWGLLERLVATGCPPITALTRDIGPFPLVARDLVVDGIAAAYGPRRIVLDKLLVDAAVEAGVERGATGGGGAGGGTNPFVMMAPPTSSPMSSTACLPSSLRTFHPISAE